MSDASQLPPSERVKRFRELAKQALREADNSKGRTAEDFRNLASAWDRLAEIAEQLIASRVVDTPTDELDQKEAALRVPPKPPESEN